MVKKQTYEELENRINALEKAAEQNAESTDNAKYRLLFEKSKDAIMILEEGRFVDCNPAAADLLGYKKNELVKLHPSQISPDTQPDGQNSFEKAKEMMALALEKGSHLFEWNHIRANGEVFPTEVLLTRIYYLGGMPILHVILRDITHRRQMEAFHQKEKETLSTILESTPHGIALIDGHGKYLYVNPYFTKITGYTLKEISTKDEWFKKVYPDETYRRMVFETWNADSKGSAGAKDREFKICCKNGRTKHIEFRSTFTKDLKISVLTDVSVRKSSEAVIREKDRLQGVLELSGAVCHEMNQPLMSIQGYFDLILMDISQDSPFYSKIVKIQAQLDRLSNITKKLMEISRYETKDYLTEKIVDLVKASNTNIKMARPGESAPRQER
ncbi:MAG: PAS domain S-box protein [Proteobacteria bacterium]|nr:PAS domain S-box protein [Pseudomonadota bacterium]